MMKRYLKIGSIFAGCGLSFLFGMALEKKKNNSKKLYSGSLRIDQSIEDESPKLFLELGVPIEHLRSEKTVIFKVINQSYICPH